MGGGVSRLSDAASGSITKLGFAPQAPTNDTFVAGTTFDRTLLGYPQNMEVNHNFGYTAASGAGGATITVVSAIYHGDASNMSDEAVLKSVTKTITWASDAAKTAFITLTSDLSGAKRYVRGKFKETKAGTITVSSPLVSQTVRFGGMRDTPHSSYVGAGYIESTDSAA